MSQSFNAQLQPNDCWRVFLSHTSELRQYPEVDQSYVHHVERAVIQAGHSPVDMEDFPARDQIPADVCVEQVRSCDVYVGIYGLRYGSPVREQRKKSYTQLEFETATQAGKPRLAFIVDQTSIQLGLPPAALVDHRYGKRQEAFLRHVREESGLTVQTFSNPDDLRAKVWQALVALGGTLRRDSPRLEAKPRQVPDLLPYLPDRHPQEERMGEALRRLMAAERATPLVVILHGEEDQRVERCRDRFLQHSITALLGQAMAPRRFDLPWPVDLSPGEGFAQEFLERIDHRLFGACSGQPPPRTSLLDGLGLVVLSSSLYTDDWGLQGARLFERLCQFWRESDAFVGQRLIHWITINYNKPLAYQPKIPLLRWFERKYWQHRLTRWRLRHRNDQIRATLHALARSRGAMSSLVVLPELESVRRSDAESWARSEPVKAFLRDQSPLALEDAVAAFYRRWEADHGMAAIPLEALGTFLLKQLEQLGQASAAGPP